MRFNYLEIYNFVVHKHSCLDMNDDRSVFIGGLVVDAPNMGSNGAGKSLIIDAIYWCLYGLRIRAQGKDDVIGEHDSYSMVRTIWTDNSGRKIEVVRYRGHKRYKNDVYIKIDGKDASKFRNYRKLGTNATIVKILGVSSLAFLYSVIFSKSRPNICEKTPGERIRLLTHIIGLDVIDAGLKNAKSDRKKLNELIHQYDLKITTDKTRLNENEKRIKDLEESIVDLEQRNAERKIDIRKKNKKIKQKIRKLYDKGIKYQSKLDKLMPTAIIQSELRKQLKKLEKQRAKIAARYSRATAKLENRLQIYFDSRKAVTKCKEQSGTECPTCKQYISPSHIRHRVYDLKKDMSKKYTAKKRAARSVQLLDKKLKNKSEEITNTESQINNEIENKCLRLDMRIKNITEKISILKSSKIKDDGKDDVKNIQVKLEQLKSESLKLKKKMKENKGKYSVLSDRLAIAEFWCEGFGPKGLKRFVINSILNVLESKTNDYLNYLTDGYMSVEWIGNSEADSKEKLQILVKTGSRKKRDYLVCSEGERARVWLATELALNDVRRVSVDIALIDECFDGLSKQGVRKAIELITNESVKRKMICISHKDGVERFFDRRFTVVLNKGVSQLVKSGEIDERRKPRPADAAERIAA